MKNRWKHRFFCIGWLLGDIYIYEIVFWMHTDECMKGLEKHKTGMFNEYVHKRFENARSYK